MNKNAIDLLSGALLDLDSWKQQWPNSPEYGSFGVTEGRLQEVIKDLTDRLKGNYPFHSPYYAAQMLKPPHPAAWIAYALTATLNPNNHALDGGPPTSAMEKEAVAGIASMFGYTTYLGHLTSSGTIANLEALWVARCLNPEKSIAFTEQSHYTHSRMCGVLKVHGITIPAPSGVPDVAFLRKHATEIGTLVVTLGTTGLGIVEPLHTLLPVCRELGIRVHVDAAYGGFFKLLAHSKHQALTEQKAWEFTHQADSIVVDPHKHGLQPYGCGCILFRDPAVGRFYKHDSPYTYFTSDALHLGEISLECSRAGASAAALWTTLQLFPLESSGGLGEILASCRKAAIKMAGLLPVSGNFRVVLPPELDIVAYFPETKDKTTSSVSAASHRVFERGMDAAGGIFVSLYTVSSEWLCTLHPDLKADSPQTTVLRSVLMKPSHLEYAEAIVSRLDELVA